MRLAPTFSTTFIALFPPATMTKWASSGCSYDTLEESYMDYCENYLRCTKSQCTGSGASVAAVATTALLAVVLAALRLR